MSRAMKPPASVAARMTVTLAALAPIAVIESLARGVAWLALVLTAMVLAMAITWPGRRQLGDSMPSIWAELDSAVAAMLVLLLLPYDVDWRVALLAVALAIGVGRQAFGGLGQPLFHPAMVGLAVVGLWSPVSTAAPAWTAGAGAAAAAWIGGAGLILRGVLPWRLPLAFLVGATGAFMLVAQADVPPTMPMLAVAGNAAWVLCAFFVASDSTTSCLQPKARLAFGLGAGALVVAMDSWQPGVGLALAMLVMNFMAPWLDQIFTTRRRQAMPP